MHSNLNKIRRALSIVIILVFFFFLLKVDLIED